MATQRISTTDVHLIELEDGNVSVTFEIISHDRYMALMTDSNAEFVRKVTKSISGLKLIRDDVEVPASETLDAVLEHPGMTNWLYDEYGLFWRKKALTKPLKKLLDAGQGLVETPATPDLSA